MAFDFASAKKLVRRVVHDTLGVPALYQDDSMSAPAEIRVRWHSKIDRFGDLDGAGWAERIEGIDRVILNRVDARALGLQATGVITIPTYDDVQLVLNAMEPNNGPVEEIWLVSMV